MSFIDRGTLPSCRVNAKYGVLRKKIASFQYHRFPAPVSEIGLNLAPFVSAFLKTSEQTAPLPRQDIFQSPPSVLLRQGRYVAISLHLFQSTDSKSRVGFIANHTREVRATSCYETRPDCGTSVLTTPLSLISLVGHGLY